MRKTETETVSLEGSYRLARLHFESVSIIDFTSCRKDCNTRCKNVGRLFKYELEFCHPTVSKANFKDLACLLVQLLNIHTCERCVMLIGTSTLALKSGVLG